MKTLLLSIAGDTSRLTIVESDIDAGVMINAIKNNSDEGCSVLSRHESPVLLPRFIRVKFAPKYLGMDKNRFNDEVRHYLTEIPFGVQGIAFDRLELGPGLRNRGGIWHIEKKIKGYGLLCESCKTSNRAEAEAYAT